MKTIISFEELYEICLSRAKDRIKMTLETTESEEATGKKS